MLADLHVHVARARGRLVKIAASTRLTVAGIVDECVSRKGLDVIGLVDAHSPPVIAELEAMVDAGELEPLPGGGLVIPGPRPLTILTASEVEVDEAGLGPVHYVCYLPRLASCREFSEFLEPRVTNVSLSSQKARTTGEELALRAGKAGGFLVPAHVFTPHKGYFGQGGTDLRESFSDQALAHVPAVELGLSADTGLADLIPSLRPFTLLTSSDAHSPESIGREHTAIDIPPGAPLDFPTLARALREARVAANYGLDPRLGKYHRAFCPACGHIAAEGHLLGETCPACGGARVVGGVLDRILEIAARGGAPTGGVPAGNKPAGPTSEGPPMVRPPYVHIVPLAHVPGVGPSTLRKLYRAFGGEMRVLHDVPEVELAAVVGATLARRISAARAGTTGLDITPGAGGRYGRLTPPT
ncbi:MAG: TIGR00375 family protein [Bacillota bacterium]|nr:MAG: TIGR00375 family protein [Bacillota bacterium]